MKQFLLTPAMGKRLIAKALAKHPVIEEVLAGGTLVIVAGTTNGYVAEEILAGLHQAEGFTRMGFRRGLTVAPGFDISNVGAKFAGDVIVRDGQARWDQTIFDVADELGSRDVILKGANAVNLVDGQAAVYIGHPQAGTALAAISAAAGRRTRLLVPVGLEKRVSVDLGEAALALNDPAAEGPRLLPLPGEVFTEIEALEQLTGAQAELVAGGGIYGAEGCVFLAAWGQDGQLAAAEELVRSLEGEPPCQA